MTNIFGSPKKVQRRDRLFQIGVETLEKDGWKVERIPRFGKASARRITKGKESRIVAIRTTQDTYIAFPRTQDDKAWVTLSDVDAVVAVSVDDPENPRFALVHMVEADEMRERFDRAYQARMAAGHSIPVGRGVWVPLYLPDAESPPSQVGGGAGIDHPPIARVPLQPQELAGPTGSDESDADDEEADAEEGDSEAGAADDSDSPLTISEAKRRLALTLGVDPSNIKITVEA